MKKLIRKPEGRELYMENSSEVVMLYQKQSEVAAFSPLMLRSGSFICQLNIIVPGFLRAICIRGHTRSVSNCGARSFS